MQRETALLYLCCTQDLPSDRLAKLLDLAATPGLDWETIFTLAHDHGVAPLVFQHLQQAQKAGAEIPAPVFHRFTLATYQNVLVKQKMAERFAEALAFFHANQIDVMLIKGMALDLTVYDQPWYTAAQDVDLLLRSPSPEWQQKNLPALQAEFHNSGIEYDFDSHHDMNLNGALPVDFGQIWRDARKIEFGGYPIYLMAPEDILLSVCINSCRKRYFRLRSLCDIAETAKRYPNLDWELFTRKAIAYGCNNIVYTALIVVAATLSYALPRQVLEGLAVGPHRRLLIDKAAHYFVDHLPLASLSYYAGSEWVGRKVGWSLLLPYLTYHRQQMGSKVQEALAAYFAPKEQQGKRSQRRAASTRS